ncbi:MAG: hypothetical protein GY757_08400 [bacterium]|nr:hypothetical protein [bacterium]
MIELGFTKIAPLIFAAIALMLSIISLNRTLNENWKKDIALIASEFLGELEKIRRERLPHLKKPEERNMPVIGVVHTLRKRLELVLGPVKKAEKINKLAKDLYNKTDLGERKESDRIEEEFLRELHSILKRNF